ncbi:PEP/pyruvate-binding domain-containing protein [Chitinispirillales bacterium ANBcel5]|uniref:PEP/pyruvate-binding domain-containing protein n=1 Tax=Cellulosispirillum alkaliphilum TaxID=3039283 RepID=UPI002A5404BC|nr:PEP/pyruvate-binding domain-containing protein [Chitinispirillales bacterium ANBcel5]
MSYLYVKNLEDVRKTDLAVVGGKGANLGEMIEAGLPVPGGFVLLTNAYREFVKINGLDEKITALLSEAGIDNEREGECVSEKIKRWFVDGVVPGEIKAEIEAIYKALGRPVIAVRSSATAEDLPGISFAGQYSTFLNVQGEEELLKSVKQCWASLWNSRALLYRKKLDISNLDLAHGVVVQHLILSEKSGVLFTANPLNGRRDQILLNSSWGLGEAIVGGEVTPDQWVVQKGNEEIVETSVAKKEHMTERKANGIVLVPVAKELQEKVTLSNEEVKTMLKLALQVENYFGTPQDVEWAYADNRFYLVQSRPVTSLFHLPERVQGRNGLRIYLNMNNYSQAMQEPFTPMGVQVIKEMVRDTIRKFGGKHLDDSRLLWALNDLGGRLFVDITELMRMRKFRRKLENNPIDKDPVTSKALLQLLQREQKEITSGKGLNMLKLLNRYTLRYGLSALRMFNVGKRGAEAGRKGAIAYGEELVNEIKAECAQLKTSEDRMRFIEHTAGDIMLKGFGIVFFVAVSSTYIEKARKIMSTCMDDVSDLEAVEKAIPHSVTTEMGMALLKIAEELDGSGKRATVNSPQIQSFLENYGHRNNIELDVGVPSWKEDPSYVVDLVNTHIENKTYKEGLKRFFEAREEAEAAIARIRKKMEELGCRGKAKKVEKMLRDFREMFGVRELSKFYLRHVLTIYREQLFEVGRELVTKGRLKQPEDIFLVNFEDIRSGLDLRAKAAENRERYKLEMNRRAPRIVTSTGESIYSASVEAGENALAGVPVSPGVFEGYVRIVRRPEDGECLNKGDIMVTIGTNPAWTPLFLKLGGLIMETGGPISHGSVVAREYGLPAVAGVANATVELKEGQRVRLNGETGIVELSSEEESKK